MKPLNIEIQKKITNLSAAKMKKSLHDIYEKLEINQRLYVNAFILLCIYLLIPKAFKLEVTKGFLILSYVFWIFALAYDGVAVYKKIYESVIGKTILFIIFSLCTNFAYALAGQTVNEITGVDPSKFQHTVILLSILSIPFFVIIGLTILFYIMIPISGVYFMYHSIPEESSREMLFPGFSSKKKIIYEKTTRVVQLASLIVLSGLAITHSKSISKEYDPFIVDTARTFLFEMEMYSKVPCPLNANSKAIVISDEKLLVGTKHGKEINFNVQDCKS